MATKTYLVKNYNMSLRNLKLRVNFFGVFAFTGDNIKSIKGSIKFETQ